MNTASSQVLIRQVAAGERNALTELYDRFAGLVAALATRVLRDPVEAEDVVQEVFVQVWRQAASYDASRGSPEAWLCTMTRTRALDRLRRRATRHEESVGSLPADAAVEPFEESLAVRKALAGLSADQRRALELAYFEGLTQSEIAERLGEPLGTIKTRIRTGMMRLRELLAPPP